MWHIVLLSITRPCFQLKSDHTIQHKLSKRAADWLDIRISRYCFFSLRKKFFHWNKTQQTNFLENIVQKHTIFWKLKHQIFKYQDLLYWWEKKIFTYIVQWPQIKLFCFISLSQFFNKNVLLLSHSHWTHFKIDWHLIFLFHSFYVIARNTCSCNQLMITCWLHSLVTTLIRVFPL